jgi:hypothetical protein
MYRDFYIEMLTGAKMQRFSKFLFLGTLVIQSACVAAEPPAPSPERQQLIAACQANDLGACKFLETSAANAQAQRAAAWSDFQQQQAARPDPLEIYSSHVNAGGFQLTAPKQVTTTCQYIGVQLVCRSY